jgi:hypothetical protein
VQDDTAHELHVEDPFAKLPAGCLPGKGVRLRKDIVLAAREAKEDIITVVGGGLVSSEPYVEWRD